MISGNEAISHLLEMISTGIEVIGVAVIVLGALVATMRAVQRRRERGTWEDIYDRYRADLGQAILLGLEFLVAADIVHTVATPLTFTNLGLLAIIVLIRTFLSFSLETEINGRWPWQGKAGEQRGDQS